MFKFYGSPAVEHPRLILEQLAVLPVEMREATVRRRNDSAQLAAAAMKAVHLAEGRSRLAFPFAFRLRERQVET